MIRNYLPLLWKLVFALAVVWTISAKISHENRPGLAGGGIMALFHRAPGMASLWGGGASPIYANFSYKDPRG